VKILSFLAFSISIQLALAGVSGAQTVESCDDIRFKPDVLERYPDARQACRGVVERDGVQYMQVSGRVQRASTVRSDQPLRIRVDGLDRTIDARPPADLGYRIVGVDQRGRGARTTRAQLKPGDRLDVLIPLPELEGEAIDAVAFLGSADDVDVVAVEAAVVALPDVAAGGMLPKTASPWPSVGMVGLLCIAAAGGSRLVRRTR